jgi:hypothetical protein
MTACQGDDARASGIELTDQVGSEVSADTAPPGADDTDETDEQNEEGESAISVVGADQPTDDDQSMEDSNSESDTDGNSDRDTGTGTGTGTGRTDDASKDGGGQDASAETPGDTEATPSSPTTRPSPSTTAMPTTDVPAADAPTNPAPTTTGAPSANAPTAPAPTAPAPTNPVPTTESGGGAANANLTWGLDPTRPDRSWTRPAINQTYRDPAYRTQLRRVTSADGTRFDRNTYSRRQAENANGTMFMTYHGDATYRVYSVATTKLVRNLTIDADGEPQWHPTDPARIRHVAGSNSSTGALTLLETNVNTGRETTIADLGARVKARIPGADYITDRAEGSPSRNGNRWAWIVYDSNENIQGIVSYDLATNTVLGTATDLISKNLDWVSMSPTGNYVLAGHWEGTYIYNADMTNRRQVTEASEHSDIALGRNGRDTYVYIDFRDGSPTAGWLTAVDLVSLERTRIFNVYAGANTSLHISGKGYDKPGWVVVSSYNCKDTGAWSCQKVMAVEIASGGRVLNLAHTYNCGNNYWTETHAVVNRSFDAVYFNSDGGSCGIDAEVYRLEIPSFN